MSYIGTKPQIATSLADNIVTADKIASGAVTDPKIAAMAATKLTGIVPDANAPSGSVVQVVFGSTSTQVESSFSPGVSLGLSVNITPMSANSRILVMVLPAGCGSRDTATFWFITLRRNTTNLINFATYIGSTITNGGETYPNCVFLDSPNTTSSISYNLIGTRNSGSANCYFNHSDGSAVSTMVAMEITA